MKPELLTFVIFLSKAFAGDDKKSVHFKIHVPEIIKHHIHTKTVFIHVHEIEPEEPTRKHNEESHVEDWTSYNSYNYKDGMVDDHANYQRNNKPKYLITPYDDYMPVREENYDTYGPPYVYDPSDNMLPTDQQAPPGGNPMGYFGPPIDPEELNEQQAPGPDVNTYSPLPPTQYAIHEDVEEEPPENDLGYNKIHETGYRRGMQSETGRVVHKDLKNFYDKSNEEEDASKGGFENENYIKYANHGYHGNYDKEIGLQQRAGKKRADRRFFVARMVIR